MSEKWEAETKSELKEKLQDVLLKFKKLVETQIKEEQAKIERLKQMTMKK